MHEKILIEILIPKFTFQINSSEDQNLDCNHSAMLRGVLDGRVLTDEEYRKEVQAAAKSASAASGLQHPAEALGELGFNPEGLGAECGARKSRRKAGPRRRFPGT